MNIPPKAIKLLTLALDSAAHDGEWKNAATMALAMLRKSGATVGDLLALPTSPPPPMRSNRAVKMPFGKYKGHRLADIDDSYLEWILTLADIRPALRRAVQDELQRRDNA